MVSWQITDPFSEEAATISLDVENGNQYAKARIEGGDGIVSDLRSYLAFSSGAFGHILDLKSTTAFDIDTALKASDNPFEVSVISGGEIVSRYDSDTPEGSIV